MAVGLVAALFSSDRQIKIINAFCNYVDNSFNVCLEMYRDCYDENTMLALLQYTWDSLKEEMEKKEFDIQRV